MSIFAISYNGFCTFSLSPLAAFKGLPVLLFRLSWPPWASLCAPWPLLWARIFLKTDQRDFRKNTFLLLSVHVLAPSHVPLAPDIPQNAPEALSAALYLLFHLPPAHPRSIFAIPYYGFGTFSLSLLVASMVLSGPLFGLSWPPGASLCRPWALLWEPFFVKSGPAISG